MTLPPASVSSHDSSPGGILNLVRSGASASRADIARVAGLAPSTVAARVEALISNGYLREAGRGSSNGGRRPRQLEVNPSTGAVCGVDLGARHASFALFDMAGGLLAERRLEMDIADGPDRILGWVVEVANAMVAASDSPDRRLRGIGMGLPGPVDRPGGRLVSPSRMPGWNGVDAGALLESLSGVPALADNDANLMALGEHVSLGDDVDHMVFVKAGSGIGCGVIASGSLYHGHRGMAGDISHVPVPNAPQTLCSCGRWGCLDAVAGGAAILASLRAAGVPVADAREVLGLAEDGHPLATQTLREAGTRTGGVMATIVNFFNPQRLVLGGTLSEAEAFVAGVRSAIYTECLPLATDQLEITVSQTKTRGGVIGAGRMILDHLFHASVVNGSLR
ncbi:ROK family transcriptional regulator [Cryobacterium tepidiphilum]|jgi:predicted NBD/HSP70 family sugar kinase|uniref:ROK family transcriptional regulator n=1 Tax=Cryobacterium tepidiphilum TaxID=2486026 RepID=A0A3M8LFA0_9MICO|nr:ROK family transcriptional regulator [Cryobacterium tepidiphilum]RNE64156.1 ROK family transcriptional regulator [Cryobacterium tepidiphilum]